MQAVLILAHTKIDQVISFMKLLKNDFSLYVHIDVKTRLTESQKEWFSDNGILWFQKVDVRWGGWSIAEAEQLLMREAMKDPDINYIHVVSGQDWVGMSPSAIRAFYEQHSSDAFLLYSKAEGQKKSGEDLLYWQKFYYNYDTINRRTAFGKVYHRIIYKAQEIFHINKLEKYHITETIFQGPNWVDLPRDITEYLLKYYDDHANIKKLFLTGFCPDEFWIQTILCNSPFLDRIHQDYHRYIVWEKRNGSFPAILDETDYPYILKGEYHFIRKVDTASSEKLMQMLSLL